MYKPFLLLIFFVSAVNIFSQDQQISDAAAGAHMIPSRVFVGDRASLVIPVSFSVNSDIELTGDRFPASPDIDIFRIAAERRPGGSRLIIEFAAYMPGILEFPPFEIAGEVFSGLKIEISSILTNDESDRVLSGPAALLVIPGTGLLIFGTFSAVIFLFVLFFFTLLRGRRIADNLFKLWRRKRLIAVMRRIEKRMRKSMLKNIELREILNTLSYEFRGFLGYITGENCKAMTARELGMISLRKDNSDPPGVMSYENFLEDFFSRCDNLRFCGNEITCDETFGLLDDLGFFLKTMSEEKTVLKRAL